MPAIRVSDALGRPIELERPPQRIVSLVPSITEALFAFGLDDRIVGVTRFCTEPREAVAGKPRVGGTKDPDVARIMALEPDLVVANAEENRREDIERLAKAGIAVFVTYPRTVRQAIGMMRDLARITGAEDAARPLIREAETELARAAEANRARRPLRVFCPIWRPWMTIGPDTYIHDFIATCGGANVFANSSERYPATNLDEVERLAPEVILLPDEPYRFSAKHVPELMALREVPAVRDERIYLVEGKHLCWYGPRIAGSLRFMQRLLWGEAGAEVYL
jgi:ABC-type Fe3+-hydroxamate transport system substrate-binding protein